MKPNFAVVVYKDEKNKKYGVETSKIKSFSPKDKNDFVKNKYYSVLWPPYMVPTEALNKYSDEGEGYWPAQILALTVTKKQLQGILDGQERIRISKVNEDNFESESEVDDSTDKNLKNEKKAKENAQANAKKKSLIEILKEKKAKLKQQPILHVDDEVEAEEVEPEEDSTLASKYKSLKRKHKEIKRQLREREAELKGTNEELQDYIKLNKQLQMQLLATQGETSTSHKTPMPMEEVQEVGDMVNLGHDIFIQKEKWDHIKAAKKDSIFVKELAATIWGNDVLCNRSIYGRHTGKKNAEGTLRKALTPKKYECLKHCYQRRLTKSGVDVPENHMLTNFHRYISEKISDLNKLKRIATNVKKLMDLVPRTDGDEEMERSFNYTEEVISNEAPTSESPVVQGINFLQYL